jgi:probable F420-dependent oxidoreductase
VDVGVVIIPTDFGADPRDVARLLEDSGFESYFFPEHTHIPASRETPFIIGGPLPRDYWRTLDPIVTMTATAIVTERLRLGTSICLMGQRDPIVTAKALATLDLLSGGRIEVGVGAGWNVEEMRNHGVRPERRWAVVREHVQAMQAIWSEDEATYAGEFVSFERVCSWPKPVQRPGIPILIGGDSSYTASRLHTYGDGWLPALDHEPLDLLHRIDEVAGELASRGAELPPVTVALGYGRELRSGEAELFSDAGVHRLLLAVRGLPWAETKEAIDSLAVRVRPWLMS